MRQLAALAPHARHLTALLMFDAEVLAPGDRMAKFAASLRLLPDLQSLEVRKENILPLCISGRHRQMAASISK